VNILYIDHYAGSPKMGMEFRPYYLSKEWVRQGHRVCIVGGSFSHLRRQQPVVPDDFTVETVDGIKYCWLKTPAYKSSGIMRFCSMIVFVMKLYKYRKRLIATVNPDAVIASSTYPLDIYPAHSIAKKSKAKLCFELHDLWPLSPMEIGGYSKWHPFIMLIQQAENYACKHSDIVVSLLSNAKEHLEKHGMSSEKFHHVINGFDTNEWESREKCTLPEKLQHLLIRLQKDKKFIAGYAGGINPSNAMKTWVDAAILLKNNKNIYFVSTGNGSELAFLQQYARQYELDNIYFHPSLDKFSVPGFLEYCDVLYVGFVHSSLHKYGIAANKMCDYMLAAKPVILSADVENSIIDEIKCGKQIPAENSEELKNVLLKFYHMEQEERNIMGRNGQKYAVNNLNYDYLAQKFIKALNLE
jgi:glycosyltransferase involved in cell wall biosynthesis